MVFGAGPSGGAAAHSASTGGGGGAAPSSSASVSTPPSESSVARRLKGPADLQGDDAEPSQPPVSKKKKRTREVGPDKNDRGLREFSIRVCEKVKSKGRTTSSEVANELVAEFANPNINIDSPDPDNPSAENCDEKNNIRRRVYDAVNALIGMEIIAKDKKGIQWIGLPKTIMNDIEELKKARGQEK